MLAGSMPDDSSDSVSAHPNARGSEGRSSDYRTTSNAIALEVNTSFPFTKNACWK